MTLPGGVVFDCDGVLVDSEPHSVAAWLAVLRHLGHPAGAAQLERCTGLGFIPTRRALTDLGPLPPPEELWPAVLAALEESFRHRLVVFDDALGVLAACERSGVPVAVASASPRERLDLTLAVAGLSGRFPVSVGGDEVPEGKPAPDVYLRAATLLAVDPERCVAVEDSPTGAAAAVAAGMRVIGVARRPGEAAALQLVGAEVVDRLDPAALGL